MEVAVTLNKSLARNMACHFMSSGHVFVRSCVSVFAVTTPRVFSWVEIAHRISQDTKADFPIPWPEATAS